MSKKKKSKNSMQSAPGTEGAEKETYVAGCVRAWAGSYAAEARRQIRTSVMDVFREQKLYYKNKSKFCEVKSAWLSGGLSFSRNFFCDMLYIDPKETGNYQKLKGFVLQNIETSAGEVLVSELGCESKLLPACKKKIRATYLGNFFRDEIPEVGVLMECICENPNYQNLAFVKRKRQVLEKIPSDLTTLFPEARELKRHFVLHVGDTNTGKTYEAMQVLAEAESGGYFAPLRLLALEGQEKLLSKGVNCSMLTGEEDDIRRGATHISCTVEMLDTSTYYDVAVIDEAQMISDRSRGYAWTNAILGCCSPLIHVCMSENALDLIIRMIKSCGDTYEVKRHTRDTELIFEDRCFAFPRDIQANDALIFFSRKDVLAAAAELESLGWHPSVIYGSLPYHARKEEMRRFLDHETNLVVATDAIGMGVNLPIRRVVFMRNAKFDGTTTRPLTGPEVKQIAGRAGRKGIYNEGFVNAAAGRKGIKGALQSEYKPLKYAGIQIPKALFDLPMKLSDIIKEWGGLSDTGFYKKVSNDHRLRMCQWLEKNYPDFSKEAMWAFLCIAYDESSTSLTSLWMELVGYVATDVPIDTGFSQKNARLLNLERCEQYYKELDLYYSFAKMFGNRYASFKSDLVKEKENVSAKITECLKTSKSANQKRCRSCGRPLSVMYTYNICQKCYSWGDFYW